MGGNHLDRHTAVKRATPSRRHTAVKPSHGPARARRAAVKHGRRAHIPVPIPALSLIPLLQSAWNGLGAPGESPQEKPQAEETLQNESFPSELWEPPKLTETLPNY